MKLLNKSGFILVTTLLIILFIGGVVSYLILKSSTDKEIKKELTYRLNSVIYELKENPSMYGSFSIPAYVNVERIESSSNKLPVFQDTILLDKVDNSYKQYKSLTAEIEFNSEYYQIIVYKSLNESNKLIERITLFATIFIILFILLIYILNSFIFERVWSDFFSTLDKLSSYDVEMGSDIQFSSSEITEFQLLNTTLNKMIGEIQKDYLNVKEFTGNISHEIQTPLAIIRLKCDLLLQSKPLNRNQAALIRDIQQTNSRLSRLNKTLILLTKIENKQFKNKENISINKVIESQLENINSIALARKVTLKYMMYEDIVLQADPVLIEVLVLNLLKNAIIHNIDNGEISIAINGKDLSVSNTGENINLSDKNIFDRYKKFNNKDGTLGLGLSLVKKICYSYSYSANYTYQNRQHIFTINFIC